MRNIEVHYLANPHGEIYFSLVSDWRDAPYEQSDEDLEILDYAKRELAALNSRYAFDGKTRFTCCIAAVSIIRPKSAGWAGSASAASCMS